MWAPHEAPFPEYALCIADVGRELCLYPLYGACFVAVAEYNPSRKAILVQESLVPFKSQLLDLGWNEDQFEELCKEKEEYFFDHLTYVKMGAWSKGRVVLLGDARHGFAPIVGMGASLALEDAYVLASEIEKHGSHNIQDALDMYAQRRTNRVKKIRRLSQMIEFWFNVSTRYMAFLRNVVLPLLPHWMIQKKIIHELQKEI